MDLLDPIVQIILFLWDPVSRQVGYLKDLSDNVASLMKETEELKFKRDEVQGAVNDSVAVGKTRIPLVENWLTNVSNVEAQVDSIKAEFDARRSCLNGCCSTDHLSRYKLGKRVVGRLKDVEILKGKGVFDRVAMSPPRSRVLEMETSLPRGQQQSTSERTLEEIWRHLHDEKNSIICIYGMGGVGKTTLMKAINNRLAGTSHFDIVIWVTVSRDLNLGLIQEKIGKMLGMEFENKADVEDRRNRLFPRLKNVRYMLILDDLWQAFSLGEVGIPKPDRHNRCKIAITTRSVEVSNKMGAQEKIKVSNLTSDEAWNLFREKAEDVVLLPKIQPLAEEVVKQCGGLPLALKTVGGAMRDKGEEELWKNALRALRKSAPEVPGMEGEVFLPLKYSYDCLGDPLLQLCFLYCSLYPEDWEIPSEELVTHWAVEEGFVNNVDNLEEALNKGHAILGRLKDACLLEEGMSREFIKMHDLLRDLAIWMTSSPPSSSSSSSSSSIQASKFLVKSGEGLVQPPEEKLWEGMGRVSLMNNDILALKITPNCPNLVSLFLSCNDNLESIHAGFFELMPKLQILELRDANIRSIPESLSLLVNLHALNLSGCRQLVEISPLGQLQGLKLLDLSRTPVVSKIPSNIISRLTHLEDLRLLAFEFASIDILREAATLTRLTNLTIHLSNHDGRLAAYDLNLRLWSQLKTFNVHINSRNAIKFEFHEEKKTVVIGDCDNFPSGNGELIRCAHRFYFLYCQGLARLSLLGVAHWKSLREIKVQTCIELKCVIDWREVRDAAVFECLEDLSLFYLLDLENVFDGEVPLPPTRFQRLRKIHVHTCPKLRCLFSSSMIDHLIGLEVLEIFNCAEMEEIVQGDVLPDDALPRLRKLTLDYLPKLSSICSERLIFASLGEMEIDECLELKKLPILCSGIQELKGHIRGSRGWWEGIEWEDDHSNSLYSTLYEEVNLRRQYKKVLSILL